MRAYVSRPLISLVVVVATVLTVAVGGGAPSTSAAPRGFVGGALELGAFARVDAVEVDPATGRMWVEADGALIVFDGADLRPITRIGSGWALLALDPLNRIAVARDGDDLVTVDLDRMAETSRTTVPLGDVDVDPLHHRLVGVERDTGDDCIVVLDAISLGVTARQCFAAVDHVEFDVHADAVLATVLSRGQLVLASFDSATVLRRVDLVTPSRDLPFGSVIGAWHVDRATRTAVLEIDDTTTATAAYAVYDLAAHEGIAAFPVPGGSPARFVVGADSTILQLTNTAVTVIDSRSGTTIQTVPLPRRPYRAALDPSSGDLYLFQGFAPTLLRLAWG